MQINNELSFHIWQTKSMKQTKKLLFHTDNCQQNTNNSYYFKQQNIMHQDKMENYYNNNYKSLILQGEVGYTYITQHHQTRLKTKYLEMLFAFTSFLITPSNVLLGFLFSLSTGLKNKPRLKTNKHKILWDSGQNAMVQEPLHDPTVFCFEGLCSTSYWLRI